VTPILRSTRPCLRQSSSAIADSKTELSRLRVELESPKARIKDAWGLLGIRDASNSAEPDMYHVTQMAAVERIVQTLQADGYTCAVVDALP